MGRPAGGCRPPAANVYWAGPCAAGIGACGGFAAKDPDAGRFPADMPITIIAVGRPGDPYWRDAAAEYLKRISRYEKAELLEVPGVRDPNKPGAALEERALRQEGDAVLRRIAPSDHVVALSPGAGQMTSEEFARFIHGFRAQARRLVFVIGGSLGLSGNVLGRADGRLSLSSLTFPHQLARVVLLEQLYRACKINARERYHK